MMSVSDNLKQVIKKNEMEYIETEKYKSFTAADKMFDELVRRGLVERRGNCLMPAGNRFNTSAKINT